MTARFRGYLVKLIPVRMVAGAALLACALAAASLHALAPGGTAALRAHPAAAPGGAGLRAAGFAHTSRKTVVSLRDLAAAERKAAAGGRAAGGRPSTVPAGATVPAVTTATRAKLAPPAAAAAQAGAAASFAAAINANFPGLKQVDASDPPDSNAAMSATQIVEVVNRRMQVYNRSGSPACATMDLDSFFLKGADEFFTDPRVIYDNASDKFTIIVAVITPPRTDPHLPFNRILKIAHNTTGDACGNWLRYSVDTPYSNVAEGTFVDQPALGQDRDALLFGGENLTNDGRKVSPQGKYVAFAYPKNCAYDPNCTTTDFPVFNPAHYAAPASSGGSPIIPTAHSYFVASVPNAGYELYQMDNSGSTSTVSFTFQGLIASGQSVTPPARGADQPGTSDQIDLRAFDPDRATRIKSTPTFDGTRIWFAHTAASGSYPAVRYGAINVGTSTVATAVAYHSPTSDDFTPSIAVGINGASRTIFLNWAYTDVKGGIPVTPTVAAVTIASTDPPPPVIGKDIKLVPDGGITNDDRFGDYSSVSVDPRSDSQACAVTAQEYFDLATSGKWATRISLFGAPGC